MNNFLMAMARGGHQLPVGLIAHSSPPVTVIPRDRSVLRIGVYPRASHKNRW
jgi:hypothetical protein